MRFSIKEFFKYDPAKDAQKTFNIEEALNQNWDKVNEMGQELSADISEVNTSKAEIIVTEEQIPIEERKEGAIYWVVTDQQASVSGDIKVSPTMGLKVV